MIPDCACLDVRILGLVRIWIRDLSSALVGMLMSSSQLFIFSKEAHLDSGVRLLLELQCVKVIKHAAFFTICALTFTNLPFNFYTSVSGCGCGFGFEKQYWWIDGLYLVKKRHRSSDLELPSYLTPS